MTHCVDAAGSPGQLCAFVGGMIEGVVAEIVYVFTCVQYKDEVSDESILLETSRDQNQAAEQKESSLEWLVLLEGGITVGISSCY